MLIRSLPFLAVAAFAVPSYGDVQITELMAAGQSVIADEDNAFPDWIELHNDGADAVNLAGWRLSDEADRPGKWTFPAVSLPAGARLVLFASGKNRKADLARLHTNFALDSSGGALALSRPDGSPAAALAYPVQLPDVSWDGARFLATPTPGSANANDEKRIAAAPAFSKPRGYQTAAINLSLSSTTPGAAIHFTLDGSVPTTGSTRFSAPVSISKTTIVRALTVADGFENSPVVTGTFLFPADIIKQSANGRAPAGWPAQWGTHATDYGMDPKIAQRAPYKSTIKNDLRAVPAFSVVMELDDLFDPETGIYVNSFSKGREWERPMSLEYLPASRQGFQINGGIRIRGGASRDTGNPKHSLQFRFRKEYGAAHLDYPMFGSDGPARTDAFDLRWDHLVSWHYSKSPEANQLQDIFGRDSQLAVNGVAKRGDLHSLYINGQFWGLYFTDERVNGDYGANHFGGNSDDYDVVRYDAEMWDREGVADGTAVAWRRMLALGRDGFDKNANYFAVQGRRLDGSRDNNAVELLDVDNIIDYFLVGNWCAATDNPPAGASNNWTTIRSRKGDFGFRFFVHDFELSFGDPSQDFIGAHPTENALAGDENSAWINPWHIWQALRLNAEFRLRVADRIQKHFFNDGALTRDSCLARWDARMDEMDRAIVAESARWGDANAGGGFGGPIFDLIEDEKIIGPPDDGGEPATTARPRFTRKNWRTAAEAVRQDYVAERSARMLDHLRLGSLYPQVAAPEFTPHGGTVTGGITILSPLPLPAARNLIPPPTPTVEIFFTTDGSDPREIGGAISASAQLYTGPFSLARRGFVKARTRSDGEWSALAEAEFMPTGGLDGLRVTELHYNPAAGGAVSPDDQEFIELTNTSTRALDLAGCKFSEGIEFTFSGGSTLAAGAKIVLVRNATAFAAQHPGVAIGGVFTGKLGDDGERLTLTTASGARIFSTRYDDEDGWPLAPHGYGFTLVYDGGGDPDDPKNWRASSFLGGSPGSDDPAPVNFPKMLITEVAHHGGYVELYNPGLLPANVSGWSLAFEGSAPQTLAAGSVIPGNGHLAVPVGGIPVVGGKVALLNVAAGVVRGVAHDMSFGPRDDFSLFASIPAGSDIPPLVLRLSYQRIVNSTGDEKVIVAFESSGRPSETPVDIGQIRISEIHYHPAGTDPLLEFIELVNGSTLDAQLGGLRIAGMDRSLPAHTLAPGDRVIVTPADAAAFRAAWALSDSVVVFGNIAPAVSGRLADEGERVAVEELITVDGSPAWRVLDAVAYNNRGRWPSSAAGFGNSLHRIAGNEAFADDPAAWIAGNPTPGGKEVNAPPRVQINSPTDGRVIAAGSTQLVTTTATDPDGTLLQVEFFVNGASVGADAEAPYEFQIAVPRGTVDIVAIAKDEHGALGVSEIVTVFGEGESGTDFASDGGLGLKAEYFDLPEIGTTPTLTTTVPEIRFDWTNTQPVASTTGFGARFTGRLMPRADGDHSFLVAAAGHVRVWIDGVLALDQWYEPEPTLDTPGEVISRYYFQAPLSRTGPSEVVVEYVETNGFGFLEMQWTEPNAFEERLVPQSQWFRAEQDPAALGISTNYELPTRNVGQKVRVNFVAANAAETPVWTHVGGTLPAGLELAETGQLTGTVSAGGEHRFTIRATDGAATAEKQFLLRVKDTTGTNRPVVQILSPANRSILATKTLTATGRVTGGSGIARLEYSLNDGPRRLLPPAADWSIALNRLRGYVAGANTLRVFATDTLGREGASPEVSFRLRYTADLNIRVTGAGSVTAGFLGTTPRVVGDEYTILATPAPGWRFSYWEPIGQTERTLIFQMEEGLELNAVFEKSIFPALAGTYTGLVGGQGRVVGYEFVVTPDGAFTGVFRNATARLPIVGEFGPGNQAFIFTDGRDGLPTEISITANDIGFDVSTGYNGGFFGEFFSSAARRTSWTACPAAGQWTVTLPADPSIELRGNGYLALKVGKDGRARYAGRMPTGARVSGGALFDNDLLLPFFAGSASGTTLLYGDIPYLDQRSRHIAGTCLLWTGDTEHQLNFIGSPYRPPGTARAAITLPRGEAIFDDLAPENVRSFRVRLKSDNTFTFTPSGPERPTLFVVPETGVVAGTYIHPATRKTVILRGIVDQATNTASGMILGETVEGFSVNQPPQPN